MASGDRVVDTAQAAELLDIPAGVIRSWAARRRIAPVGYRLGQGQAGRVPLYVLDELEQLAATYRPKPRHADKEPHSRLP